MYKYEIGDFPTANAQGWCCPKCGRVYSPSTPMCFYCSGPTKTVTNVTTTTDDDEWWRKYLQHTSIAADNPNIQTYLNDSDTFRVHFNNVIW